MATVIAESRLIAHPDGTPPPIQIGTKTLLVGSDVLKIEYVVTGRIKALAVPACGVPKRQDHLWQRTCFEAFIRFGNGTEYVEFNVSPTREYAAYRFEKYRDGMQPDHRLPAPDVYVTDHTPARFALDVWIDLKPLKRSASSSLGLSAVIEATGGTNSYWALAHPPGAPDFHDPACFTATLPAPGRA